MSAPQIEPLKKERRNFTAYQAKKISDAIEALEAMRTGVESGHYGCWMDVEVTLHDDSGVVAKIWFDNELEMFWAEPVDPE